MATNCGTLFVVAHSWAPSNGPEPQKLRRCESRCDIHTYVLRPQTGPQTTVQSQQASGCGGDTVLQLVLVSSMAGLLDEGRPEADDVQDAEDNDVQDAGFGREEPFPSIPAIPAPTPVPPWIRTDGAVVIWQGCDAICSERNHSSTGIPNPPPPTARCQPSMPNSGTDRANAILRQITRLLKLDGNEAE